VLVALGSSNDVATGPTAGGAKLPSWGHRLAGTSRRWHVGQRTIDSSPILPRTSSPTHGYTALPSRGAL
jgi:hypothetical protein